MRILILGGDGMLGHQLLRGLGPRHEVKVTLRKDLASCGAAGLFDARNTYDGVDVRRLDELAAVMADARPEAVLNAVGIVKQRPTASLSIPSLEINSLLPHRLATLCSAIGARLVHVSTDCVFSGRKGGYVESDPPDPEDLYGRTKLLGEVHVAPALTLRTSIIGPELARQSGLLEWFLAQDGPIKGFRGAIFSGVTTLEMARVVERVLTRVPGAHGLYHVSSDPISKYDLLLMLRKHFNREIEVVPDEDVRCDRSLDSERFRREFAYQPPTWNAMCEELASQMRARERV